MSYQYELNPGSSKSGQAFAADLHSREIVGSGAGDQHDKRVEYFDPNQALPTVWHADMSGGSFAIPRQVLETCAPLDSSVEKQMPRFFEVQTVINEVAETRKFGVQLFSANKLSGSSRTYQEAVDEWISSHIDDAKPENNTPMLGLQAEKVYAWDQWFQPNKRKPNKLRNEGVRSSFVVRITVNGQTIIAGFESTTFTQSNVISKEKAATTTGFVQTFLALA